MKTYKLKASVVAGLSASVFSMHTLPADSAHAQLRDGHRVVIDYFLQELDADIASTPIDDIPYSIDLDYLGLEHKDPSGILSYHYRSGRWMYSAGFYRFRRKGGKVAEAEFDFAGVEIQAGAAFDSRISIDTYVLDVMYSLWRSDRSELAVGIGLHLQDIEANLNVAVEFGSEEKGATVAKSELTAPLPNIRVKYFHEIASKWSLNAELGWLSLSEGNASGDFFGLDLWAEYQMHSSLSLRLGYQSSNTDADKTKNGVYNWFDGGFAGPIVGVSFSL